MTEDRFFEKLREDARGLRFDVDDVAAARIAARIRSRIAAPAPTPALFLARWFRPLAATFSAVALAAAMGVVWIERSAERMTAESLTASSQIEISAAGDIYSVGE